MNKSKKSSPVFAIDGVSGLQNISRLFLANFHGSLNSCDTWPKMSTALYMGSVKNVVSRYMHKGSSVFACFLDASGAFDSF